LFAVIALFPYDLIPQAVYKDDLYLEALYASLFTLAITRTESTV